MRRMDDCVHLGIDPASTRIALVAYHDADEPIFAENKKLGKSGAPACSAARQETLAFVEKCRERWPGLAIVAAVESPVVGRGGPRATIVQAFASGAIQGALFDVGVEVSLANVSSWKKRVVGNGRASKEDIANFVGLRWPTFFSQAEGSQDLADAICIARYGELTA